MATIIPSNFFIPNSTNPTAPIRSSSTPKNLRDSRRAVTAATMSSDLHIKGRSRFLEFPYASAPVRNLMVHLVSMIEDRFGSQLLPCSLPEDVQFYQSESGSSQASLHIRSGSQASKLDYMMGSWLQFGQPTGEKLNISCIYVFLNSKTDAPNFIIEVIESNPTSMALILDLPPRKDLVLHPEYLKVFYEDTNLDAQRQLLCKLPEVTPYVSPSLHIRSVMSPTAIFVNVQVGEGGAERMEEIVGEHIHTVATEVLRVWLDLCALEGRDVGDEERLMLEKRDGLVKNRAIEIDLEPHLPRLFGQETADRVIAALRDVINRKIE